MNENKFPFEFSDLIGSVMLVCGDSGSGRSTFLWTLDPEDVVLYIPKFRNDRKKLVVNLSSYPAGSIVGIESNLPNLIERSDEFLNDLCLLSKINKHIYALEWKVSLAEQKSFFISTREKYAKTIVITHGIEKKFKHIEGGIPRFAALSKILNPQSNFFLKYFVPKYNNEKALEIETYDCNVSRFLEDKGE